MMGLPKSNNPPVPNSPAIPSDFESDVPSSPISTASEAPSSEFGSTPSKSAYQSFPRTPGTITKALGMNEVPSSRLRHSVTMRAALKGFQDEEGNEESVHGSPLQQELDMNEALNPENISFDMADVDMAASNDSLRPVATPFAKTGQVNYLTMKEQERVRSIVLILI